MIIQKAEFTISSPSVRQCPDSIEAEYAFIGRSNVGKSSLINMLTGHKGLAKTSSMPGKTMLINHFLIRSATVKTPDTRSRTPYSWYVVDLPGYGYAKRSKREQEKLNEMIRGYIIERTQMVNLFLLVDGRHTPQRIDLEFIQWLGENGVPFSIVFTKADKLSRSQLMGNVNALKDALNEEWEELPPIFITSAETSLGRDDLLNYIESINQKL